MIDTPVNENASVVVPMMIAVPKPERITSACGRRCRVLPPPLIRDDQRQDERNRDNYTRQQTITGNSFVNARPESIRNDLDQKAVWNVESEIAEREPPDSQFEAPMREIRFHIF